MKTTDLKEKMRKLQSGEGHFNSQGLANSGSGVCDGVDCERRLVDFHAQEHASTAYVFLHWNAYSGQDKVGVAQVPRRGDSLGTNFRKSWELD